MSRISSQSNTKDWNELRVKLLDRKKNTDNWKTVIDLFEQRIQDRYFNVLDILINLKRKSLGEGFSILTLECTLIEYIATLENGMIFKYDKAPDKAYCYTKSAKWYNKFLNSAPIFNGYFHGAGSYLCANDFYQNVRCGLIHEARTRNGWKVGIFEKNKNKDKSNTKLFELKTIYRTALKNALSDHFQKFCNAAKEDSVLGRRNRKYIARKLDVICEVDPDNKFWW